MLESTHKTTHKLVFCAPHKKFKMTSGSGEARDFFLPRAFACLPPPTQL
jgi:hypothetical protein